MELKLLVPETFSCDLFNLAPYLLFYALNAVFVHDTISCLFVCHLLKWR